MDNNNFTTADQIFKKGSESKLLEKEIAGVPVLVIPKDMTAVEFDTLVDQRAERPKNLSQTVEALSVESFLEYFNRYADNNSTIFVDIDNCKFVGVLDYHEDPTSPRWKRHQVIYNGPFTKEWNDWTDHNDHKFSQVDFALFIEDHMKQFETPSGGDMLNLARTLKVKSEVDFESGVNLHDGQVQFKYIERLNGTAGNAGEFSIPEEFSLALRIFQNEAPWKIKARFRYRKSSQGLTMWYTLQQPHLSVDDAVNEMFVKIKEGITQGEIIKAKQ